MTSIRTAAPQFLIDELKRALAFYEQSLGFDVDFVYDDFYAGVSRDGALIHLKCAPKLDAERHIARSPVFWRAYFEQAPGDGFTLLWHGALLLGSGEASRAAYVLLLARQAREIEKPIAEAIDGLLDHSQLVVQRGAQRVSEAAKLHDEGNPAQAAARLRTHLVAWPANALAHYELGLAIAARQYAEAGRKPPPRSRLSLHAELQPSAEVLSAYARARTHDPLGPLHALIGR